jgi:uncharacterized protein (DUF1684 family)
MSDATERLWLADWRRRVAELYAEVRTLAATDPAAARAHWVTEREALYKGHPSSPVLAAERATFAARHWPYDERLRLEVPVEPVAEAPVADPLSGLGGLSLPNSGDETLAFDRVGRVTLPLPDGAGTLALFWMRGYTGGLFLPFRDATSGEETYGAGRYVLDTGKGADLGSDPEAGSIVVDLNFAYQPSCAFDPKWACPLAPPENRLAARVEAGERLR